VSRSFQPPFRVLRRFFDPHMHIVPEVISAAFGLCLFVAVLLGYLGVWPPIHGWVVVFMAAWIALDWTLDLVQEIARERRRVRAVRELYKHALQDDDE
jgi:small-conductance mechanosensitive channel